MLLVMKANCFKAFKLMKKALSTAIEECSM